MITVTDEETANLDTLDAFLTAWNAKDAVTAMTFFASDFRFTAGEIGKTPDFSQPDFVTMIDNAISVDMKVTPGTTWARGPVVTHERVDDIPFRDGTNASGKFIAVFTFRDGKIVDFIDFKA